MRVLHGLLRLQALADGLKLNTSLTSIDLGGNDIGDEGCQAPPGGKGGEWASLGRGWKPGGERGVGKYFVIWGYARQALFLLGLFLACGRVAMWCVAALLDLLVAGARLPAASPE